MSPLLKPKFLLVSAKKMLLPTLQIGQRNMRNVGIYEAAWPLAHHTGQNNSRKMAWMQRYSRKEGGLEEGACLAFRDPGVNMQTNASLEWLQLFLSPDHLQKPPAIS